MKPEEAVALRAPFRAEQIGKLPKGGSQLDYVGHAAVTDRLLEVDPGWSWEPVAWAEDGGPLIRYSAKEASLWIRLTVAGVTRIGVGICPIAAFELEKQLVSDALRNAAMRFGVALDLWSRQPLLDDVHSSASAPTSTPARPRAKKPPAADDTPVVQALIDQVKTAVERLDAEKAQHFADWKAGHDFPWPWTPPACRTMLAELARIDPQPDEEPF